MDTIARFTSLTRGVAWETSGGFGVILRFSGARPYTPEHREKTQKANEVRWWAEQGSNLRPQPCKGCALPTELSARRVECTSALPVK